MCISYKFLTAGFAVILSCSSVLAQGVGGEVAQLQVAAATSEQAAVSEARRLANASIGRPGDEIAKQCREIQAIIELADPAIADAIRNEILQSQNRILAECLLLLSQVAPATIDEDIDDRLNENRDNPSGSPS